jgi:Ser/Thr protein kinase RdoA (MazF antagonist)
MAPDLRAMAGPFSIIGRFQEGRPYGGGHINDTYLLTYHTDDGPVHYILQRINHQVFRNPPQLMDNLLRVTAHLRQRLQAEGVQDLSRRVLTVIPTQDGALYHQDPDGNYWRVFEFLEGTVTVEVPQSLAQIQEAARAFGRFVSLLSDLPGPPLHETIPDFHNGVKRYTAFEESLSKDGCNRAAMASWEIAFIQEHAAILETPARLIREDKIPMRVTHNDTKVNNVLLDRATGEGLCVIDLDTVMPGLVLYDVGDIVRTAAGTAAEDEPDLSKVKFRRDRFEAIIRGFLEGAGRSLHRCEVDHLVLGGPFMTLIMGTRFLTDFLQGDTYYKIHRPNHNLDRCRVQFRLAQILLEQQDPMDRIVRCEAGA